MRRYDMPRRPFLARTMQLAKLVALAAATALIVVVTLFVLDIRRGLPGLEADVHATLHDADATVQDARRVVLVSGGLVGELRDASKEWKRASRQQADYFTQIGAQTNAVLAHLDQAIVDQNAELKVTHEQARASLAQLDDSLQELAPILAATAETAQNAATVTGDPALLEIVRQSGETAHNVNLATASLAHSSQMVEHRVEQLTAPKRWIAAVGSAILDLAGKVGPLAAALLK